VEKNDVSYLMADNFWHLHASRSSTHRSTAMQTDQLRPLDDGWRWNYTLVRFPELNFTAGRAPSKGVATGGGARKRSTPIGRCRDDYWWLRSVGNVSTIT